MDDVLQPLKSLEKNWSDEASDGLEGRNLTTIVHNVDLPRACAQIHLEDGICRLAF